MSSTSSSSSDSGQDSSSHSSSDGLDTSEAESEHRKSSLELLEAIHRLKKAKSMFYRAKAIADDFDHKLDNFKKENACYNTSKSMKSSLEALMIEKKKELSSKNVFRYPDISVSSNPSSKSSSIESGESQISGSTKYVSASTDYECMLQQQDERVKEIQLLCESVDARVEDFDNEVLEQTTEKYREMKRFLREYNASVASAGDDQKQ
uniref:Uncharacterized protein n=1 Tax=Ditylenchus dipsaci TaxID=166011 RepID=A0A915DIU3_9BILA